MTNALDRVRAAFDADFRRPPPEWAAEALGAGRPRLTKILVVEDSGSHQPVTTALRGVGYRVVGAAHGGEAFDTARIERPDLVVIDVEEPGGDGHVICRRLKTSVDLAAMPVVVLTPAPVDVRRRALALGADEYLVKPVESRDLERRIEEVLERRAAAPPPWFDDERLLSYEAFVLAAQESLARGAGRLALVRLPIADAAPAIDRLIDGAGSGAFLGPLNEQHLLVLTTGAEPRIPGGLAAGVAASGAPGATVEALIYEADETLNGTASPSGPIETPVHRPRERAASAVVSVLLADDDPVIQMVARMALARAQFDVTVVGNGRDVLARAAELKPHLILLDWIMPDMDGLETCARLKANPATRDIPVVFLTGRSEASEIERGLALGAVGYIAKPFNPMTLGQQVRALLKG